MGDPGLSPSAVAVAVPFSFSLFFPIFPHDCRCVKGGVVRHQADEVKARHVVDRASLSYHQSHAYVLSRQWTAWGDIHMGDTVLTFDVVDITAQQDIELQHISS